MARDGLVYVRLRFTPEDYQQIRDLGRPRGLSVPDVIYAALNELLAGEPDAVLGSVEADGE